MARTKTKPENGNGSTLGFEAKLWLAADKLRTNLDAAEYKHVVLGLIFLKYTSDAFEEQHAMEIRCRKSRVGNPVSVHHSCPKGCEKMKRHRIKPYAASTPGCEAIRNWPMNCSGSWTGSCLEPKTKSDPRAATPTPGGAI